MMRIAAFIAGIISLLIAVWFLGWMVVSLNSIPLWIIMGATIGMMIFDFYQSMKEE